MRMLHASSKQNIHFMAFKRFSRFPLEINGISSETSRWVCVWKVALFPLTRKTWWYQIRYSFNYCTKYRLNGVSHSKRIVVSIAKIKIRSDLLLKVRSFVACSFFIVEPFIRLLQFGSFSWLATFLSHSVDSKSIWQFGCVLFAILPPEFIYYNNFHLWGHLFYLLFVFMEFLVDGVCLFLCCCSKMWLLLLAFCFGSIGFFRWIVQGNSCDATETHSF